MLSLMSRCANLFIVISYSPVINSDLQTGLMLISVLVVINGVLLHMSPGKLYWWQTLLWPRRPIKVQFLCPVQQAVVSMATPGLMACALYATRSIYQDRTMEELVLWVL